MVEARVEKLAIVLAAVVVMGARAMSAEGLTTVPSSQGPKETMDRLETEIKAKGMIVFARIDHAAGAAEVGLVLRPTTLLIFGNARGGTPLMQSNQTIGIDLPEGVGWQDTAGKTWLSYNDPSWRATRHGLGSNLAINTMAAFLSAAAKKATTPPKGP